MKIYYIMHSCFLVELKDRYLLFDYFDKNAVESVNFTGSLPVLSQEKKFYLFASHGHKDHFDLNCLKWEKDLDIHYILSKHIRLGANYLKRNGVDSAVKEKITFVTPLNTYRVDDMVIETLRSTDEGVAFVVTVDGKTFYHAGDHNWWASFERDELYGNASGMAYKRELRRLENRHIDVAFVVLDPRVEQTYYLGMDYFIKHIDADLIFPMHMWKQYEFIDRFKRRPDLGYLRDKIVDIECENMLFDIEE